MLFIDLKRDEKEPMVIFTKSGERIEIRHNRGPKQIGIGVTASEEIKVFGPHLVRKMNIPYGEEVKDEN